MPTGTRTSKRVLFVCGSRSLLNRGGADPWGRKTLASFMNTTCYVFTGGAVGPDRWAEEVASFKSLPTASWLADGTKVRSWEPSKGSWFYKNDGRSFIYTNNMWFPAETVSAYTEVIDVTRKSAKGNALFFAPSWAILSPELKARKEAGYTDDERWSAYSEAYRSELEAAISSNQEAWSWMCNAKNPTLLCYCKDASRCHRSILARRLSEDTGSPYWGDGPTPLQRNTAMVEHLAKLSSDGWNVLAVALVDPRSKTGGTAFTLAELCRCGIKANVFEYQG